MKKMETHFQMVYTSQNKRLKKRSKVTKMRRPYFRMMGRSMDHVASFVTGMSTSTDIFDNENINSVKTTKLLRIYEK